MGRRCCVASCDNAVNSTLFAMPKDDILFCMWCKVLAAIGINLQKKHFICEQHFEKNFINDTVIIKDKNGKILFQVRNFYELIFFCFFILENFSTKDTVIGMYFVHLYIF